MKKLKDRYFIIKLVCFAVFCVIAVQLASLQIIHGRENVELSTRKLLGVLAVPAPRGDIVDRNNAKIAATRMGFSVYITKAGLDYAELNSLLLRLVGVFDKNGDIYSNSLDTYLTFSPVAYAQGLSQKKLDSWLKNTVANKAADVAALDSPKAVFKYLRKKYSIDSSYSDDDAGRVMTERYEMQIRGFTKTAPLCLADNVSMATVAEIEEDHDMFPGVSIQQVPFREYFDAQPEAQVIGYVRGITVDQYKQLKDKGYNLDDIVGQSGIESAAEGYLRGKDGISTVETDNNTGLTSEVSSVPAVPGDDVVLTLDAKLQEAAMASLEKNIDVIKKGADYKSNFGDALAGAAVAMDVNTGEILAMASYPSYDPSIFVAGGNDADAKKAISALYDPKNEARPLFNRAISGTYAPGSTFKPIVAIAGLQENVITPQSIIRDTGVVNIGGRNFYSLEYRKGQGTMGDLNLERALATSNNIFFHILGYRTGIESIDKWAQYFGLGQKTGIDLPGENAGVLASKEYKQKVFKDVWRPADTAQAAIGQLYNNFTPLQLADYVSAVANGGKLYKPYVIQKIVSSDGTLVKETKPDYKSIPVEQSTLDAVKAGMVAVTNASDGTAATIFDGLPFKVAGKTGTAETGAESNHSSNALFVCYAPADKPQIAIAVVVERGAWGANTAPIARDMLDEYFHLDTQSAAAAP